MTQMTTASTPDFRSVRIGLRAPRVAITFEGKSSWESRAALALYAAGQVWGGSGFIVVPEVDGKVNTAVLRTMPYYDPDYVLGLAYTSADIESIEPGQTGNYPIEISSAGNGDVIAADRNESTLIASSAYRHNVNGTIVCPADWFAPSQIPRPYLTPRSEFSTPRPTAVIATPAGVGGPLGLALAMRCGFAARPVLPFVAADAGFSAGQLAAMVRYSMLGPTLDEPPLELVNFLGGTAVSVRPEDQPHAWADSEVGLATVEKSSTRPRTRCLVVVGSTSADFALALAWDRMFKRGVWLPETWLRDQQYQGAVRKALFQLTALNNARAYELLVTSTSLDEAQVRTALAAVWPPAPPAARDDPDVEASEIRFVPASGIPLSGATHLACAPEDYDISLALPVVNDGRGGFSFAVEVPVYTPGSDALQDQRRPFWEIDVEVSGACMPPGRVTPDEALSATREPDGTAWVRNGRAGVSFVAHSMGYIPGGASLRQAVARPRLRYPGLVDWVTEIADAQDPPVRVENSAAGYRAQILARLWGDRPRLASDIFLFRDFFREFAASSQTASRAYPAHDGVPLVGGDGILTFRAGMRMLSGPMTEQQIRSHIDRLLGIGVLRRGLALGCGECDRLSFIAVDDLGQTNSCPRCGALNALSQLRWRNPLTEPEWYYDLHGAVRELLRQNGDVPLLATHYFATRSREFVDVPELDFYYPSGQPKEIDFIALVDGEVIVGEAKKSATLGSASERTSAITKLLQIGSLVRADQLLLCTSESGAWSSTDTEQFKNAIAAYPWIDGRSPSLRNITGLGNSQPADDSWQP
jgi:hypothetical protein